MAEPIKLVANPQQYDEHKIDFSKCDPLSCIIYPIEDFLDDPLSQKHDEVLQMLFHTLSKYGRALRLAEWITIAIDQERHYVSSVMVCRKKNGAVSLEYVMTDAKYWGKGASKVALNRTMQKLKKDGVTYAELMCDPLKNNGQLPKLYRLFGFKKSKT